MDIFNIEPMKDLLKKINTNSELEIIFNKSNPLTINKFIDMLKYMTVLSKNKNYKLVKESTLDVSYTMYVNKDIVNYRITISNIDNINKIINNVKLRKNHVIFSLLVNYLLNDYKDMSIMKKTKLDKNIVDIENYDMRVRLSEENEVSKDELKKLLNIDEHERHNVRYRFKERISVVLSSDDKHELKIDLTQTKQVNNINDITKAINRYELEMDLSVFDKFDIKKIIDKMNEYSENIYKNLNTSNLKQFTMYINAKNKTNDIITVSTADAKFYYDEKQIQSPYKVPIPIVKLQPEQEIVFSAITKLGTEYEDAMFNAACIAAYKEVKPDEFDFFIESRGQLDEKRIMYVAMINIERRMRYFLKLLEEDKTNKDVNSDKTEGQIIVNNEDHTLGNLIARGLQLHPKVAFAGYNLPHPLAKKVFFHYKLEKQGDIKQIIKEVVEYYSDIFTQIRKFFE